MLDRDACREVVERVLRAATADEVQVDLSGGETSHLRFARNTPSTSGTYTDDTLSVTCTFGTRSGTASVNQLDPESVARAVRRAEEIARRAPEDPEHVPPLEPQEYAEIEAWSDRTAAQGAELMAEGVAGCLADARSAGLIGAGFTRADAGYRCIASSNGLFGYHPSTEVGFSETVRTPDATGSGWATAGTNAAEELDYARCSAVAIEKARRSAHPQPLEPGRYVTILEPACVANLLELLTGAMGARSADEGRTWFSAEDGGNRIGEQLFPQTIDLRTDPADPRAPGRPWGGGGLPAAARPLIRAGELASLNTDRYWAEKSGVAPVPAPTNLLMAGGDKSLDELVRSTERGVLITSMWYIRAVDPRSLLFTGLTRDGVFWIEDGEIVRPLTNFRWNDSPAAVLKNTIDMSKPVRTPPRARDDSSYVVPALKVSEFTLSSVSEAV